MVIKHFTSKVRTLTAPVIAALWLPVLYLTLANLGLILTLWESGDRTIDEKLQVPAGPETFDFIVVGAGSAGSVVANRLSKYYSVLLLEAGGEPNPLQLIPGFGVFLINYPQTDWMHRSVPQKTSTLNSVNQQSSWSAGRGLGGTGTLNLMVHLRGHRTDFDNWAKITGDPSWSWEGVLPYFKSYEDHERAPDVDPKNHGFDGPLRIEAPHYSGFTREFVDAGGELGYPETDLNSGDFIEGFGVIRYPTKNGVRQAPYQAFIQPIRFRKSFIVRKYAHVTKILMNEANEVYGVQYDRHGSTHVAYAKKEVILSAGTITTPRILMLSGIGPAEHLQELGIPIRKDLPVGQNLQDHTAAWLGPFFVNQPKTILLDRDITPSAFVKWFTGGRGPLSNTGAFAAGFVSSSFAKVRGEGHWPDLILYAFGVGVTKGFGAALAHAFSLKLDEMTTYFQHAINRDSYLAVISGARPFSKGYIKLGGTSPYDSLIIEPNYFSDPGDVDLKAMVEGMKATVLMAENTTAIGHNLGGKFTDEVLPGCEGIPFRSDAYWECYARRFTVTLHHPVGTCGMGRVVDTKLRVYGTKRLRVIDASIQPEIVTSNTQASTLMIGEKGADMILRYWLKNDQFGHVEYGSDAGQEYYGSYSHHSEQVQNYTYLY